MAGQALPAAADAGSLLGGAGIHHFTLQIGTIRTFQRHHPPDESSGPKPDALRSARLRSRLHACKRNRSGWFPFRCPATTFCLFRFFCHGGAAGMVEYVTFFDCPGRGEKMGLKFRYNSRYAVIIPYPPIFEYTFFKISRSGRIFSPALSHTAIREAEETAFASHRTHTM